MIDYINNNLPGFWITVGFALLAAEVLLFGFTTLVLLFAGLGALATGLLMMLGVLPPSWIAGVASFGITTGVIGTLMWKPLQNMQNKPSQKRKSHSDFVGLEFVLEQDVGPAQKGHYRYSGVDWSVEVDASSEFQQLHKGQQVRVTSIDVGVLKVSAHS